MANGSREQRKVLVTSGTRESCALISLIGRPVCKVSSSMNSGSRDRSKVAALERTVNRVDASALLQTPLEKFCKEDLTVAFTVSRDVESIVAMHVSVAGLMIWIRSSVAVW